MTERAIAPLERGFDVTLELPGSKSLTNRYLLLAALASGTSTLERTLIADDVEAMLDCVVALGAEVELSKDQTGATIIGVGGRVPSSGRAFARQSGTTARFIAPVLGLADGPWELDGSPQLRARPMADLFEAMRRLGAEVSGAGGSLSLPVTIRGPLRGGSTTVSGAVSSQFLSGLLLASPLLSTGLVVEVEGVLVSRPYVEMTVATMRRFGAHVDDDGTFFAVKPTGYEAAAIAIEPDASSASYFFAAAACHGGSVRVTGLGRDSLQGDVRFVDVLEQMGAEVRRDDTFIEVRGGGALHGVEVDLGELSDTVPTLAVVASFADTPTRITGVGFIRNKESDRIGGVVTELRRCGIDATEEPDGMVIRPGVPHGARVNSYDDHRMAMAFAVLGLGTEGIVIEGAESVAKTFPDFFESLDLLRSYPSSS
jgi:3-phosphoshikimate 1-carboxyvinyltransferase